MIGHVWIVVAAGIITATCAQYYRPLDTDPSYFTSIYAAMNGTTKTVCAAACSQNAKCVMYTCDESGLCTLLSFDWFRYQSVLLPPGNTTVFVALRYSVDFCYVAPLTYWQAIYPFPNVKNFCARLGGKVPEVKNQAESTSLATLNLHPFTGLNMDTSSNPVVWRWASDNSLANFTLGSNTSYSCSTFTGVPPYFMVANTCAVGFQDFACQLC